jgi:hypothetical protein
MSIENCVRIDKEGLDAVGGLLHEVQNQQTQTFLQSLHDDQNGLEDAANLALENEFTTQRPLIGESYEATGGANLAADGDKLMPRILRKRRIG